MMFPNIEGETESRVRTSQNNFPFNVGPKAPAYRVVVLICLNVERRPASSQNR